MDAQSAKDLARYDAAKKRKTNISLLYEEAMGYAVQNRDTFNRHSEGQQHPYQAQVFDSTATSAVAKFASNLQSRLVPPMKRWIRLTPGVDIPNEMRKQSGEQLDGITERLFAGIHNSNFDTQVSESFQDLAVGTGALMVMRGTVEDPFRFVSVPLSQLTLEEADNGKVGAVFRDHQEFPRDIKSLWPDAAISPELSRFFEQNPNKKVHLVDMVIPQKVNELVTLPNGKKSYIQVDGYKYCVYVKYGDQQKSRIVHRTQKSSPWVVFRWSVVPGEVWGRGPLLQALPDIKTLNKTKELTLKNAAMDLSGAWTVVDSGVINVDTIGIYPGAVIPVESNGGGAYGATIQRLEMGGKFDVSQLVIEDMVRSINDIMFTDPLGPIDMPVKSATEVSLRQQELANRIGAAFGRLQHEFINPLISRLLFILEELGVVDLSGFKVDGNVIAIKYVSPLAAAQDEEDLINNVRYVQYMKEMFGPEIAVMMVDPQKFGTSIGKLLSIKEDMLPSEENWKALQNGLQQRLVAEQQQVSETG